MRSATATLIVLACAAPLAATTGCVERKLVIRSDPPGAVVQLEDQPLDQVTPVEVETPWDGVRRVTLSAPGHKVLETTAPIETRWHDYFPLDVFAEFLWPGTIRDVQVFDYRLEPYYPIDQPLTAEQKAELKDRLVALRGRADAARAADDAGPVAVAEAAPAPTGGGEPPPPPAPRGATAPAAKPSEPAPLPAPGATARPAPPRAPRPSVDLPPLPVRPDDAEPRRPTPPGQQLPPPVIPPAPVKK
jgi:hypothetical protein